MCFSDHEAVGVPPAELDPIAHLEAKLAAMESENARLHKSNARLRNELRILSKRAEVVERAIIVRDLAAKYGVTGDVRTWEVIDTPDFQQAMCELFESVDEWEPRE